MDIKHVLHALCFEHSGAALEMPEAKQQQTPSIGAPTPTSPTA